VKLKKGHIKKEKLFLQKDSEEENIQKKQKGE